MIGYNSYLCHAELRELTNLPLFAEYVYASDSGYTYRNSIPDAKFFFWFEKSKLTSHLIHVLQMANQLIGHRQDAFIMGG